MNDARITIYVALAALALLGCRTGSFAEGGFDAAVTHDAALAVDLATPVDLPKPSPDGCSRENPTGFCAEGTTCCVFDCWGGSDEKGWCWIGEGCPVC